MKSCGKLEYPYRTVKYYLTIASIGFKTRKYRVQPGRVLLTKEKKNTHKLFNIWAFPIETGRYSFTIAKWKKVFLQCFVGVIFKLSYFRKKIVITIFS